MILLLENGAHVDHQTDDQSVLMIVVSDYINRHPGLLDRLQPSSKVHKMQRSLTSELARILLEHRAQLELKDNDGNTALLLAALHGDNQTVYKYC